MSELIPIFLKIPPEHIALLNCIVETYEELGIIRTLNPLTGEIVILALSDTQADVFSLLESLKPELNFRIVPPPSNLAEDWLLSESL